MVPDGTENIDYRSMLWFSAILFIVSLSILYVDNSGSLEVHKTEFFPLNDYQYANTINMPKFLYSLHDCNTGYVDITNCTHNELAYYKEMVQKTNLMNKIFNISYANNIRADYAPYLIDKSMGNNSHPWAGIYKMVTSHNHTWCSLSRDNWACYGNQYDESLKRTRLYQGYTLLDIPRNTVILGEGNSYLAEKLYYLICETNKFMLNNHGSNGGSDVLIKYDHNNDIILHLTVNNLLLVLIDNHYSLNTTNIIGILHKMMLRPHIIIVGHTNTQGNDSIRFNQYNMAFPDAHLINPGVSFTNKTCYAPSCDSKMKDNHHQCFPGPTLIEDAQDLIQTIMNVAIGRNS